MRLAPGNFCWSGPRLSIRTAAFLDDLPLDEAACPASRGSYFGSDMNTFPQEGPLSGVWGIWESCFSRHWSSYVSYFLDILKLDDHLLGILGLQDRGTLAWPDLCLNMKTSWLVS